MTSRSKRCNFSSCRRESIAKGLCPGHYWQQREGRNLTPLGQVRFKASGISNDTAHWRVVRLWGKASDYPCVSCPEPAKDWAYDGTDPTQEFARNGKSWSFHSLWPEFYIPLCRSCHAKRDRAAAQQELYEYRSWKSATGLTLRGWNEPQGSESQAPGCLQSVLPELPQEDGLNEGSG